MSSTPLTPPRRRRLWMALGLLAAGLVGGFAFLLFGLHPALAQVDRVPGAKYLVVEGWLPSYAMVQAVTEFRRGGYEKVFSVGVPYRTDFEPDAKGSYASSGAGKLREVGIPDAVLTAVASQPTHRNRTYEAAVALREYLGKNGIPVEPMNVITVGTHGRRSRLCVQRAFGGEARVGVISLENPEYDPERWWKFSEGVKDVIGEAIGFTYAWLSVDYGA